MNFTYKVHSSRLSAENLELLRQEFNGFIQNDIIHLRHNLVEIRNQSLKRTTALLGLFKNIKIQYEKMLFRELYFDKLWLVRTIPGITDFERLPYTAHFDKTRYFKAMVYMSDVDINCGPIFLANFQVENTETVRKLLPSDYKIKNLNKFSRSVDASLIPIIGNAGTIVFFDTNTPHKAGIVRPGHYRDVIRMDFIG